MRVRKDLEVGKQYGSNGFVTNMEKHLGKEATISEVVDMSVNVIQYHIDIDSENWFWTKEMLEPITIEKAKVDELKCDSTDVKSLNYTKIGEGAIYAGTITADKIECFKLGEPKEEVKVKKEFKTGDRVIVMKSNKIEDKDTVGKEKLVGAVGVIDDYGRLASKTINGVNYKHSIRFEDETLQAENYSEGVWLFADGELASARRIEIGQDYKIIVNYPAVIYVIKKGNKVFKGIAKVMENDLWNEERGIQIAKKKAEIKILQSELKELSKF